MTYLINFAIAPYFLKILISELKSCNYYSISHDESLNDITETCQKDIHVRYWSSSKNQICVLYLDSKFMGHATANYLLKNFSDLINNVDGGNRMIQVSVDGPRLTGSSLICYEKIESRRSNITSLTLGLIVYISYTVHLKLKQKVLVGT